MSAAAFPGFENHEAWGSQSVVVQSRGETGALGPRSDHVRPAQTVEFGLHSSQALTAVEHENVLAGQETERGVAVGIVVDRDVAGIVSVAWCESLQDDLRLGYSRTRVSEVRV